MFQVNQFWPLVQIQCSPDLKFFLCSMYTPICMENYHKPLPACRAVCQRAKAGCAPIMQQYGFAWPPRMNCDDLPRYGDKDALCMDFNSSASEGERTTLPPPVQTPSRRPPSYPGEGIIDHGDGECECNHLPITNKTHALYGDVTTGGIANCAMPCEGAYFSEDEKKFAHFWIGLWSVLCCISSFITVLTFLIDRQRFQYPERPIIFLSGCYTMVSIGYIIRLVVGHHAVACDGDVIRYHTTGPALCTVVFLLIYFFGMASSLWWVVLSLTWFLSAGLKWGQEAIERYSQYFHLVAWLVPSVQAIVALALSAVDGDPVAGICYVGNQDVGRLRGFVLAPLCVYLVLGGTFLTAGFVAMCRIRAVIRQQGGRGKTAVLEKLMIRIGVFSVLYTVPAVIVLVCHFYEQHYRTLWELTHNNCLGSDSKDFGVYPDYSVFMLKYFMCLVVGITSGFWVWSGKTIDSWRRFYGRCCGRTEYSHPPRMQKYAKQPVPVQGAAPSAVSASQCGSNGSHKQMPLSHV